VIFQNKVFLCISESSVKSLSLCDLYRLAKNLGDRSINRMHRFEPRVLATLSEQYALLGNRKY